MPSRRVTAATIGLAAVAGAATATGALARRATVNRRRLDGIERIEVGADRPFEWAADRELTVRSDDGVLLHVEIDEPPGFEGGPTVVFSHGYCLALGSWIHQRRAVVAAGYRSVSWDQRGHGRSGFGKPTHATIEQLGADLGAVIAAAVPDGPLVLVGHSMGGMTMMALADLQPELVKDRVAAVVFVATSAGGDGIVSLGFGRWLGAGVLRVGPGLLANIAARQNIWRAARSVGRDVESYLVEHFSFASPVSQETVRYAADMLLGTDLNVVGSFLPTFEAHDKRAALAAFAGCEALVLNGEGDVLTPPDHSTAIVDALPGAEHVVITDAGHLVMLEHPALVDAQLLAAIARVVHPAQPPATRRRLTRHVTDVGRRTAVAAKRRGSAGSSPGASRRRPVSRPSESAG